MAAQSCELNPTISSLPNRTIQANLSHCRSALVVHNNAPTPHKSHILGHSIELDIAAVLMELARLLASSRLP